MKYSLGRFLDFTPTISMSYMTGLAEKDISLPQFDGRRILFCRLGREALWESLRIIGVKPHHNVLVPAYLCPIMAATILKFGSKVKLYAANRSFQPDLNDIQSKIDENTKALLVVNYFGFPQPYWELRQICDIAEIYLIEDCAMALYSSLDDRPFGTFGDVGFFSMRKTLPVDDGAALVVNNPALISEDPSVIESPVQAMTLRDATRLFLLAVEKRTGMSLIRLTSLLRGFLHVTRWFSNYVYFGENGNLLGPDATVTSAILEAFFSAANKILPQEMRSLSRLLIGNSAHERIKLAKVSNYRYLLDKLEGQEGITIIFPQLPDGICPLSFPIYLGDRDVVCSRLAKQGIPTGVLWPEVPAILYEMKRRFPHSLMIGSEDDMAEARYMNQHILRLPVHQGLEHKDIDYMAKRLIQVSHAA